MAASFRCYDNSDVIAFLIMTNFHLYLIKLWWQFFQMFVYGDVVMLRIGEVLTLKNCYSIEPPSYASAAYVVASYGPRFFSTVRFVKIRATCEKFLGKWFTTPPGKKFPVRLFMSAQETLRNSDGPSLFLETHHRAQGSSQKNSLQTT